MSLSSFGRKKTIQPLRTEVLEISTEELQLAIDAEIIEEQGETPVKIEAPLPVVQPQGWEIPDKLTYRKYQQIAMKTMGVGMSEADLYLRMGIVAETGEVFNLAKKIVRGDYSSWEHKELKGRLIGELGDILWYVSTYLNSRGHSLKEEDIETRSSYLDRNKNGNPFELLAAIAYQSGLLMQEGSGLGKEYSLNILAWLHNFCKRTDYDMHEIARKNLVTLEKRYRENKIKGHDRKE